MKRLFMVIFLMLFSVSVYAATTDDLSAVPTNTTHSHGYQEAKKFASELVPPKTDYSVAYLSQIFGTVGDVLQSASGQMLGQLFDIFNKGVMVVAALWVGMNTAQIVVRAAQEGSFMGQNRNAPLIFLRVALGFAFLIPSSTTGYSLLQDLFMKVVVQGVGLADKTWDAALHYLRYGGELYIPPSVLSNDRHIVAKYLANSSSGSNTSTPFVAQIFQDEVCMIASQTWAQQQGENTLADGAAPTPTPTGPSYSFSPVFDSKAGAVFFPGVGNTIAGHTNSQDPISYRLRATNSGTAPFFTTKAACGAAVDYYWLQSHPTSGHTAPKLTLGEKAAEKNYSFSALKQVVLTLLPAAQAYYNEKTDPAGVIGSAGYNALLKSNGNLAFSAILAYVNLMTPYQHMLGNFAFLNTPDNSLSPQQQVLQSRMQRQPATYKTAKERGWIMAGSFYWSIEQANNAAATVSISSLVPSVSIPDQNTSDTYDKQGMNGHQPLNVLPNSLLAQDHSYTGATCNKGPIHASLPPGIQNTALCVSHLWTQFVGAQQNNVTVSGGPQATSLSSVTSGGFLGNIIANDFGLSDPSSYNPITVLMNTGNKILTAVISMWQVAIILSVVMMAAAGWCASTDPTTYMFQGIVGWIKSIVMLFSTLLLLPGATLSYYVPLYPFALYTFAAVGWIALVIEGMAAAPLIAAGVTHPEGHDFLGKGEQALMFIISIFIRPTLMVIGLIAGMITSFVAFKMLNSGFAEVLSALSNDGSTTFSDGFLTMLNEVMVLVVFGMMTMELIEQCYKLIYQLPLYVMRWIGGPQMGEDYGQLAAQVRGAVSSTAGSMREGMQGIDQANAGATKEFGLARRAYDKEQANKKTSDQRDQEGTITGQGAKK